MKRSIGASRLDYGEYRAVIAEVLGITDVKAIHVRLQQLQKMSIPHGSNTGRGTRPGYTMLQALETLLAFDLLDIGLMPAGAVKIMERGLRQVINREDQLESVWLRLGALDEYRNGPTAVIADTLGDEAGPVVLLRPADRLRSLQHCCRAVADLAD